MGQEFSGGWPVSGILGQAALHQGPHLGRQFIKARLPMDDTVDQRMGRPGAERALARGGKGEHRAKAEYVAWRSDLMSLGLLR
jgi:hypothetical protein